jgi:hypothetical protein
MNIVSIATLVGFVGDACLQILVNNGFGGSTGWGLKPYFKQHGSAEAMCIAAGMLAIFFIIYVKLGLPLKVEWLAVYGVILDLIFRKAMIFPSLSGYYTSLNYFESAIWGAIPMVIPLVLMKRF